jgi:sialate O-acetylesterase
VAGKNTITYQDVLIGDVWMAAGQSNMQFGMAGEHNAATELPQATDNQIRYFWVSLKTSLDPQKDLAGGSWVVNSPDSAKRLSAVGYYFAKELRAATKRPIGIIHDNWGGTPAQAWTSIEALQKEPLLQHYVDAYTKLKTNFAQATADFPAKQAAYNTAKAQWDQQNPQIKAWNDAVAKAHAAAQPAPPKPATATPEPPKPTPPDGGTSTPSVLFNGMIAPAIPYGIKGVIWYQGESNAGSGYEYKTLFSTMITDWRARWGEGDFPFLFVQLTSGQYGGWTVIREDQDKTLSLPNTGMAVIWDIGDFNNIHPIDKSDVGHRLALIAEHDVYGQKDLVFEGPRFDSMKIDGDKVTVTFSQVGGGLVIGSAPWVPPGGTPVPTDKLRGFTIAGADKKWHPADAMIDGNTVVVSSPSVPAPVAVRFAWATFPEANFYNKEGLPAAPFRTDDWDDVLRSPDVRLPAGP